MERATKHFQPFTSEQRTNQAASFRLTRGRRESIGVVFWTHNAVPGIAFPTRKAAETAAAKTLSAAQEAA